MKNTSLPKALYLTYKAGKMDRAQREKLKKERLARLIKYAKDNSPYYAGIYKDVCESTSLDKLPVTDKKALMENFDSWMTDRNITKNKVERFMSDLNNVGTKLDGKYLVYTTSGSTGNPCIILYDDTAINVSSAIGVLRSFPRKDDMKAFMKSGGKTMALFSDNGFYLGCGSVRYTLNKMPWKKKQMKTCDVRRPLPEIDRMLNEFNPSMIGTYPTQMEILAEEQKTGRLNIRPAVIMTGGEHLDDDLRRQLSETFGCYVGTNYSCTEGGTVACECTEGHFHINDDWVIIEPVDKDNNPVPYGVQSDKVLLTNLANKICPIIRFEITDRVIMHDDPCPCGKQGPWLTLEGRTDDILTFSNGTRIPPLSLYAILKEVPGVQRFQLVQTDTDLLKLRLISADKQTAFKTAKARLQKYLSENGTNAEIVLSDEEPQANAYSGKYQHVIAKRPD